MVTETTIIGIILTGVYGALLIYAGYTQVKKHELPTWSPYGIIIIGLELNLSLILLVYYNLFGLYAIVLGLTSMHVVALYNGYHLNKKINFRHQFVRLGISALIIVLIL
jgi:hypothetical protein